MEERNIRARLAGLQEELEAMRGDLAQVTAQADDTSRELDSLRQRLARYRTDSAAKNLEETRAATSEREGRLDTLRDAIDSLSAQLSAAQQRGRPGR